MTAAKICVQLLPLLLAPVSQRLPEIMYVKDSAFQSEVRQQQVHSLFLPYPEGKMSHHDPFPLEVLAQCAGCSADVHADHVFLNTLFIDK